MKVILDECLPKRLGKHIVGLDVVTVSDAGFAGLSNGKLLRAISERFEVFVLYSPMRWFGGFSQEYV